jgi:hypothetical protein
MASLKTNEMNDKPSILPSSEAAIARWIKPTSVAQAPLPQG